MFLFTEVVATTQPISATPQLDTTGKPYTDL